MNRSKAETSTKVCGTVVLISNFNFKLKFQNSFFALMRYV